MATATMGQVIANLRKTFHVQEVEHLTDAELVHAFIAAHDEEAFAALVRRHGPMVLGVCRRLLQHAQDAEDAFQATFLVLVRKATPIKPAEMVGNWLYGVAFRTALAARTANRKRRSREKQVKVVSKPELDEEAAWRDLQLVLDQELSRLPDKYRLPVVLCDLEGKSRKAVARQLDWPEGTVAGRLARARALLAKRLARHGLALSGGAVAALCAQSASARVPALLQATTIKLGVLAAGGAVTAGVPLRVASLLEGVLKSMLLARLKIATALLLVIGIAGLGAGVIVCSAGAAGVALSDTDNPRDEAPLKATAPRALPAAPSVRDLLSCLNGNAKKVQSLECKRLELEFHKGTQSWSMQAKLAYKNPHQFRLVGEVLGKQEMDIGCNEKEFWCWIKLRDPPLSYHGKYHTWAESRTLPLAPDWLLDLLGLSEQKEPPTYELSVRPKTIELTQASSFFSRAKRKISVFNRSPHPIQIAGYRLEDAAGKELYSASITEIQRDRATGAVLPRRLELNLLEQRITIKATLADIAVNAPLDRERAARLFASPGN